MNLRLTIAIIISKFLIWLCRLVNLGGTTLPGRIALKIYPNFLCYISKHFKIIMVTGTNGKTTTTKIIGQMLAENKIDYISNKSGANLLSGVTSTFIEYIDFHGNCDCNTALIEIDEAAFNKISNFLNPDILVVTNFFRDQLDRYGELYSTLKAVKSGILKSQKTTLILNADDSLCASLGKDTPNHAIYYGINRDAYQSSEELINSDAMFCLYCKSKYEYENHTYGHLGHYKCPKCEYERPETQVSCMSVVDLNNAYSLVKVAINNNLNPTIKGSILDAVLHETKITLPGLYNIYNALAALTCGCVLNLPIEKSLKALHSFESGFGRMETIPVGDKFVKIILVKNPTGFNQVLNFLITEEKEFQLAFLINDKVADGTDVSWLWDVDFEKLQAIEGRIKALYTSGIRAEDMSIRLKYAGMNTEKLQSIKDYDTLITTALSSIEAGHSLYLLPTYTAMFEIRKILTKKFGLKDFWR